MREPPPAPFPQLPVVAEPARRESKRDPASASVGAVDAQLLGQGGARRGLRGGPPVLEEAQHAYLEAEWSGPADRRTRAGQTRREKV